MPVEFKKYRVSKTRILVIIVKFRIVKYLQHRCLYTTPLWICVMGQFGMRHVSIVWPRNSVENEA